MGVEVKSIFISSAFQVRPIISTASTEEVSRQISPLHLISFFLSFFSVFVTQLREVLLASLDPIEGDGRKISEIIKFSQRIKENKTINCGSIKNSSMK